MAGDAGTGKEDSAILWATVAPRTEHDRFRTATQTLMKRWTVIVYLDTTSLGRYGTPLHGYSTSSNPLFLSQRQASIIT